jgi:hypothetical protein
MIISKTDYLEYRECKKNAWVKIYKPDVYKQFPPSEFDQLIMRSGGEVENVARDLFPGGIFIRGRDAVAQATTLSYIEAKQPILFQAVFQYGGFLAATDVLEYDPDTQAYNIYEIKSKNDIDKKTHYHDAAFQVNLLKNCGIKISKNFIIHLNKEYKRFRSIDVKKLFTIVDVTEEVDKILEEVSLEATSALKYLSQEELPKGHCQCIYKGRGKHCTTFTYINPDIPQYSVHDLSRITPKKLQELVDNGIFTIETIMDENKFTDNQQSQIRVQKTGKITIEKDEIAKELKSLHFPLYFIDYETYAAALPRYDGYSPYMHIPFQFALCVLDSPNTELKRIDFIYTSDENPDTHFTNAMRQYIGDEGTIIVWHKTFETGQNSLLAKRLPELTTYLESINSRIYDLKDIFSKRYYVHKGFLGKTSIKNVLPIIVPTLTYKTLDIRNGGSASEQWNRLYTEDLTQVEREKIINNLKEYCGLDAYAMYAIWKELLNIIQ